VKPICIDGFCGLGGWAEGFLAEGWDVLGFDIERHRYGNQQYPGELWLQDALTVHGSQFKDANVLVMSPPCQNYSYLAMPWSRSKDPNNSKVAKALRLKWETEGPDNRLFDVCFRIQREAIEATRKPCCLCLGGHVKHKPVCPECYGKQYTERHIPLIVENVRGAQPWVGRSAWNYGSFHLWGDVPALMPINVKRGMKRNPDGSAHPTGSWFAIADSSQGDRRDGQKVPGFRFDGSGRSFQTASVEATGVQGTKGIPNGPAPNGTGNTSWFFGKRADPRDMRLVNGEWVRLDGTTIIGGDWFSDPASTCRKHGSRSQARKAASAQIAKIPFPLSQWIAQVYKPRAEAVA
jgi:hypothetical protein